MDYFLNNKCLKDGKQEKMIYICNVIFCTVYGYYLKKIKKISFTSFLPIIILWTIILGGQYGVGTDYFNYINIFEKVDVLYKNTGEYIFYYFIVVLNLFTKNAQSLFIIVGSLESLLFVRIFKLMEKYKVINTEDFPMYIFLFLTYGTLFYNQMNVLRQYFDIYLLTLAVIYMLEKKLFTYILLIIVGAFIHRSIIFFLPFYFFYYLIVKKINQNKYIYFYLFCSFILLFIPIENIIKLMVLNFFPRYSNYVLSEYTLHNSISGIALKIIFFPVYWFSIKLLKILENENEREMLKIAILGYGIRLITLKFAFISRIGEYFVFITIFPILYVMRFYAKNNMKYKFILLLLFILIIFILKVTLLAKNEYSYRFILFN